VSAVDVEGRIWVGIPIRAWELYERAWSAVATTGHLDLHARDVVLGLLDVRAVDACDRWVSRRPHRQRNELGLGLMVLTNMLDADEI
jgi:hypothetical protein